jgi:hypothetical protein
MWSDFWGFKGVDGCGLGFDLVLAIWDSASSM